MTDRLKVKEHLQNSSLYQQRDETLLSGEWKHKLFYQHALQQQLKNALKERNHIPKWFFCIGAPILCMILVFTTYFGFINPAQWFENIRQITKFNIPPIGLKEAVIFVILVNGLTFMTRKRSYFI